LSGGRSSRRAARLGERLDLDTQPRFDFWSNTIRATSRRENARTITKPHALRSMPLASNDEVRERRAQLTHPRYAAPELLAPRPNQLWSWDITKLKGPATWTYYPLPRITS
jgi:transposase InsO family protein